VQLFGIFSLWLVLTVGQEWIVVPRWVWYLTTITLGIGWELLIDNANHWWLGVGIAGAATALALVTDLVLVATDYVRMLVLRRTR
jgi:hypothetical protein